MRPTVAVLAHAEALALALLALAAPAALGGEERPVGAPPTPPARSIPGRVIVEWRPGVTSADRVSARGDADTTLVRTLGAPRFQLVRTQPGQTVSDAIATLRADPAVKVAEPDGYSIPESIPNDPLFNQLWGLRNAGAGIDGFLGAVAGDDVDAPAAWDRTVGTPTTVIADLDTGYRFTDGDLGPVAWTNPGEIPGNGIDDDGNGFIDDVHGMDFVGPSADSPSSDADPTDDNITSGGHGLHTAGTMGAAGNNGVGITGVARNVRIMPLRVCANSATGPPPNSVLCLFSSQIAAINYAGANGARAANMSLGSLTNSTVVRDALAANPSILFIISAGNGGADGIGDNNDTTPTFPCSYPLDNIICVAATDQADQLATFSNFGATSVDLGAPGTETLSTYLASEQRFHDDFQVNDFASKWSATTGTGFGRAGVGDGPLTSFGITDSPGATPSGTQASTLTTGVSVPAGYGSCTFSGMRFLSLGGGSFSYSVLSNNVAVFTATPNSTGGSAMAGFQTGPITGLAGTTVKVSFSYTAGGAPTASNGVWIDDPDLTCYKPLSAPLTYAFLEGTSMAAPHVTGAAGLLFSLKPSATVAEVKGALLASVTPDPALAGKTTSGGRLDVARAMSVLVPPDTAITARPVSSTTSTSATFQFKRGDSPAAATFECRLDAGGFAPCASPAVLGVGVGSHIFQVRARDAFGRLDPTPASAAWTVRAVVHRIRCIVPRLKGKSLRRAKRALAHAHCALGKVKKPRRRKGHKPPALVVKSSRPRAGAIRAEGAKVALTLKVKPKRHRRHR